MAFYDKFPYTNFQELNLDWTIQRIVALSRAWAAYKDNMDAWAKDKDKAFNDLRSYVMNFFDDLDVQDEIDNKLEELYQSGRLDQLMSMMVPYVTPEMFGAVGDGVADDTAAIQAAFNSGKLVLAGSNVYKITDTLVINESAEIHFTGTIESYSAKPALMVNRVNNGNIYFYAIKNKNKVNDFQVGSFAIRAGCVFNTCLSTSIRIDMINDFTIGFILACDEDGGGCFYNEIDLPWLEGCLEGVHIINTLASASCNANIFKRVNYHFHSWPDVNTTPYVIRCQPIDNTYRNNSNYFMNIMAENGIENLPYPPALIYAEHIGSCQFIFKRIEMKDLPQPSVKLFTDCEYCTVEIMQSWNRITMEDNNSVRSYNKLKKDTSYYYNGTYIDDLLSSITLQEGISLYYGESYNYAGIDTVKGVVYLNLILQCSQERSGRIPVIEGLPGVSSQIFFTCTLITGSPWNPTSVQVAHGIIDYQGNLNIFGTVNANTTILINEVYTCLKSER